MRPRRTYGAGLLAVVLIASACSSAGGGEDADGTDPPASTATIASTAPPLIAASLETVPSVPSTTVAQPSDDVPTTTAPTFEPVDGAAPLGLIAPLQTPIDPPLDIEADETAPELGTLEIPKLGVVTPLFDGIRLTTFDRGAGHWPGTAMPGYIGNSVIGGHRTTATKPFRNLDQLAAGDQVIMTTVDGRFVYEVTGIEIVDPQAMEIVRQTLDFTATLFACHPPGSTDERIVAHLVLVPS